MRFPEKQQLIIFALLTAVVVGFAVLRFYPLRCAAKGIKQAESEELTRITVLSTQRQQLPELHRQVEQLRIEAERCDAKITQGRNFALIWEQIAEVMNAHDLKDQLIQPESEITDGQLSCIPISIKCSGTLSQVFEFFKSLQQFERLIRLEQVKLVNDADFSGRIKVESKVNVYYRPVNEESVQG